MFQEMAGVTGMLDILKLKSDIILGLKQIFIIANILQIKFNINMATLHFS